MKRLTTKDILLVMGLVGLAEELPHVAVALRDKLMPFKDQLVVFGGNQTDEAAESAEAALLELVDTILAEPPAS